MPDSYPFMVYSGIFEPKHYKQIGPTIWFFLWCIKSITEESVDEEGVTWGHILYKKPMTLQKLAEPFEVKGKTISRWLEALEQHQYIKVVRAPYGLILSVKNSKKYKVRTDKNVRSEDIEETKMSDLEQGEETIVSDLSDKNVRSNIVLIKILIDRLIDGLDDQRLTDERCGALATVMASMPEKEIHLDENAVSMRLSQIDRYYLTRKGKLMSAPADYPTMMQLARMKIPMEFIQFGIDLSFARHEKQKRWPTDEINLFSYCQKVIIGTWNRLNSEIKEAAEPIQVLQSASPKIRITNRQTDKVADLRRRREEARIRDQG